MIRKTKLELGSVATKVWKDAKIVGTDGNNILSVMRKFGGILLLGLILNILPSPSRR